MPGSSPTESNSSSRLLGLPLDLILAICSHVPPNDIACSLRLCCTALHDTLSGPQHCIVRLSSPVEPRAFDWALRHGFPFGNADCREGKATRTLDGLTFDEKILLSELVASTGVLANLVILHRDAGCPGNCSTPRAAAAASHLHVLQWLEAEGSCLCCVRVQQAVGSRAALPVLQWYDGRGDAHPPTLFAAAGDDEDVDRRHAKLQYLYDKHGKEIINRRAIAAAARRGDLLMLSWLKGLGATVDATALVAAAGGGHVAAAVWVVANGGVTSLAALQEAASEGQVAMMEWLAEQQSLTVPPMRWRRVLGAAASGGHAAAVQWLLRRVDADQEALEAAAEGGRCEVMGILLQHGSVPTAEAFGLAAKSGSTAAMQLLLDAAGKAEERGPTGPTAAVSGTGGEPPSATGSPAAIMMPQAYMAAALSIGGGGGGDAGPSGSSSSGDGGASGGGHVRFVSGISSRSSSSSGRTSAGAGVGCAGRGRNSLEALQWLDQRGCPAGDEAAREEATGAAALLGSRPRLEWLRARGFGWSARTFAAAAASGCIRLVEWMAAQGCPMGRRGDALLAAGANSDAAMLDALRRLGCPWAADVLPRAVHGVLRLGAAAGGDGGGMVVRCRLEVLRWMVSHGCPVTKQAYLVAKQYGRNEVADWLKQSGLLH